MLLGKRWREVGFHNLCLYLKKGIRRKARRKRQRKKKSVTYW